MYVHTYIHTKKACRHSAATTGLGKPNSISKGCASSPTTPLITLPCNTPYKNHFHSTNLPFPPQLPEHQQKENEEKTPRWPTVSPRSPPTSTTPKASSPIKSPSSPAVARASAPRPRSYSPMKAPKSSLLISMLVCFPSPLLFPAYTYTSSPIHTIINIELAT